MMIKVLFIVLISFFLTACVNVSYETAIEIENINDKFEREEILSELHAKFIEKGYRPKSKESTPVICKYQYTAPVSGYICLQGTKNSISIKHSGGGVFIFVFFKRMTSEDKYEIKQVLKIVEKYTNTYNISVKTTHY